MHKRSAVVFAYHSVGVRGIKSLLAQGVDIKLVVSHEDNPNESIWFESVAALCEEHGIPRVTPENPNTPEFVEQLRAIDADFFFSFYYRNMLSAEILSVAKHGAYNLHGSLLPKYRGRVPVNWAVLHGETETGATLHEMTVKPDAGAIISQIAVPILPDDTAFEVFGKLTVAAEQVLWQALPGILTGSPTRTPNDLSKGSYFGGRKPEDGRIDWSKPANEVYNLHRAVAPPYPGAFFDHAGQRFIIEKARLYATNPSKLPSNLPQGISVVDNSVFGICGDGKAIRVLALQNNNKTLSIEEIKSYFAS
ncbi:formyltransferase [Undibacterium cyanobacteriorum]|uniref:Formyltransferase n=1 Tax=Undibacterium cyanobacteriorum TaxID=3073561 RepID=A0ABY9RNL5_9BURK|nr:formyltransferase [Undibacterium sp. 20NA77.5]WMW82483.1 formyltransferase [Undibacterium sp. 20NA77.5]